LFIPLYVDVEGWRILVFGGGSVGLRRARMFLEAGAREVVVASKEFSRELVELANRDERIRLVEVVLPGMEEEFGELVDRADLVVIASSSKEANKIAVEIASRKGKLVNNATSAREGNTIVPFRSSFFNGEIHVAVTSLGRSGVAARRVLEKIEKCIKQDRELETLARVMARLKDYLKENIESPKQRLPIYFEIEKDPLFTKLVSEGREEEAYERGLEIIRRLSASRY